MKHYIKIFISSLLAGFCIVIGASVYLSLLETSKIVGSLLFGFGLFVIINFELHLYTGKVGFILDNKPKYLLDLLVCLIGNFIGVIILASLIKLTRVGDLLSQASTNLVSAKQNDSWYSIFLLSFMCGIMIYLAVLGHKKCPYGIGKALLVFFAVSIFILCGFEHCIANAVYYTYAGIFNWKAFWYFVLMIVGNGLGSILFDGLLKLINKCNKE